MANNIIKRVWNQNRMVNIEDLCGMAFQAEAGGHTFQIFGVDDTGVAVPLSGTVAGVFRRPDNADIALTGSASEGVASVTLTEDCYAVPGFFGLTIFVTSGGQKTAVYAAVGTVAVTSGGAVAGDTPQDVVDLINAIAAAVATIPADYTDLMTAIAPIYSTTALYPVGSYVWYDGNLYRCTTPITTAETWTAAHWMAAVLGDDVCELKSSCLSAISFKKIGDISKVISNVKVYGGGTIKYAITNINNNFNGFTGVVVYTVSGSTFSSALTITLANTQGAYVVQIGREAIEFDYNLDNMATGSRITSQDDTAIIKDSCYVSESSYVTTSAIARIISNVRILTPASVTYYLGYASRNDSIAVVQIYSSENNYAKLQNINIGIGKGHISEKIADGAWITFDYDMSWTSTGINYGNYINAQTQIKPSCVTELVEKTKNPFAGIFASAGMFETMGVVGDSYASGQIWKNNGGTWEATNCWPISWIQILARKLGSAAFNFSFGGLTTRSWLTAERGKAYLESESAKQLYLLCLGINDVNALGMDYLGSGADYNTGADTFYGNYSTIIRAIQAHAPNAKIIMFTTPFTSNSTYVAFNNAIIAIATHFGLPYVEQYLHPFIASSDFSGRLQYGHPTAVMYSGMAQAYEELLANCLYNNVDYFKEYLG